MSELQGEPTVLVRTPDPDGLASALPLPASPSRAGRATRPVRRTEDLARSATSPCGRRGGPRAADAPTDLEALYFELTTSPETEPQPRGGCRAGRRTRPPTQGGRVMTA